MRKEIVVIAVALMTLLLVFEVMTSAVNIRDRGVRFDSATNTGEFNG